MKLFIKLLLFVALSVNLLFAQARKKIACIGDSVTKGASLTKGKTYPEQLQALLGSDYEVANFGRNGATLLEKGHNPYLKSEELLQALAFKPDIVVISLGLNDTDPRNWPNYQLEFQHDYLKLISTFEQINPAVEIYICKMSPIFSGHSRFLSGTRDWYQQIQAKIDQVAVLNRPSLRGLIDNHGPLASRIDLFDDYLHPSEQGAAIIADNVFRHLKPIEQKLSVQETIGSHMVLQRDRYNKVSGKANPKQTVQIKIDDVALACVTDLLGNWKADLPAMSAGGPYQMEISTEKDTVIFEDILVGDVYLASGQSNMAFELKGAKGSEALIHSAKDYPNLRLFKNKSLAQTSNKQWDALTLQKVNDLAYFEGQWERADANNAAHFSAIAYSFAQLIQQDQNIPVGIIQLAVGGSNTESWIPRKALEGDNLLAGYIHNWRTSDFIQEFCKERAGVNLKLATVKHQRHPYDPAYNFEAGVSKWLGTSLKGVLWYQGESNAHQVDLHEHLFKTLVRSWRENFRSSGRPQSELPFYMVQLSSIDRPSWALFRDSQRKLSVEIPKVYMAVSSDLGDSLDVHPKDKIPVGLRLANLARKHEYGQPINADSPQAIAVKQRKNNRYEIQFTNAKELKTRGAKAVRGFQAMDKHGVMINLHVVEIKGNTVVLDNPTGLGDIYYGYQGYTNANLENEESVPVSTFHFNDISDVQ